MRDLLVYVADKNMAEAVGGLLDRPGVHQALGCAQFAFDTRADIKVAAGQSDPGLYVRAAVLIRPYRTDYRRAIVIVDEEWHGSPGAVEIRRALRAHLDNAGWEGPLGLPLVVSPEADVWLWSDSPHTPTALGWGSWGELRPALQEAGLLTDGQSKPARPKEAAEWALRRGSRRIPRSSRLYRDVSSNASVQRCQDPVLMTFIEQLRTWFPMRVA